MNNKKKFLIYDLAVMLFLSGVVITITVAASSNLQRNIVIPPPHSTITMPRIEIQPPEIEVQKHINDELQDPVVEVDQYIQYFMQDVPMYRYRNAREYAPYVVAYAEQFDIDPLLLAVTISLESSWYPDVVGQKGELGLMQVHGVAARGYDLTDAEQQIEAGASWLAKCIDKCDGDVLGGVSMYQAGTSCRPHKGSRKRFRLYKEARKEIRGY